MSKQQQRIDSDEVKSLLWKGRLWQYLPSDEDLLNFEMNKEPVSGMVPLGRRLKTGSETNKDT